VEDSTILDGNPSKLNENDLQMLISDLLDGDQSFATKNGARFNMAQREIAKNEFHQSSIIVDFIVQCMEPGINSFLKRTKILYDLQYLSHAHPKEAELRKTSKDMFLKVITGTLADELLSNYLALLGGGLQEALEMGLEGSEQQLTLIWQLVVSVMSDLYRRLKQEFESPPYTVLALSDADPTTFALEWNRLQQKFTACKYCVDIEFTSSLLEAYPGPLSANTRSGKQTITEIQRFLGSVCDGKHPHRTHHALETTAEKEERFQLAATRKIRRLSGWNIFQKQELEGNSLDPGSYRNKVKAIGQAWAHMSEEEKLPFEAEAARLEELRHELANTPLAAPNSKSAKTQALEDQISRNSCKLFSARRLLLNEAEFDRHPLWQLPTCLADSNGAIKASKIILDKTDEEIDAFLDESLHKPIEAPEAPNDDEQEESLVHESPCFPFLCCQSDNEDRVTRLVKSLYFGLRDHDIKTGSLLLFTHTLADGSDSISFPCVLGVTMKKPILHILIRASLDDQQVYLVAPGESLPHFQLSHAFFVELLEKHHDSHDTSKPFKMIVEAWECKGFLANNGPTVELRGNPTSLLCKFQISSDQKSQQRKSSGPVKVPFGLDKINKRRKAGKAKARKKIVNQALKKKDRKAKGAKKEVQKKGLDQRSSDSLSMDSDPSSENDDSANESGEDLDQEEIVDPMSSTVKEAEQEVKEAVKEVVESDSTRSVAAARVSQNPASFRSSFFAKEIGLDACAIAVSGRSVCLQCKVKIAIHSVRFSWYHSTLRPSSWCHSHCLFQLVQATGLKDQAIKKLKEIVSDCTNKASSSQNVFDPILAEARKVLAALESAD
ncbi:PARP-type domain-containing protein (Fragment), partial [Durusdinium trenchii]